MTEKKGNDESNKISRRKMIKGAAATAMVSAGLLAACNPEKKGEQQPATMKIAPCDHTGSLAVWLALTRSGHLSDSNPDTWGSTSSDVVANGLATDMGLPAYQTKIKNYVDHLRSTKPPAFSTMEELFKFVQDDLDGFSAFYGGPACPLLYSTIKSIAQICP